MKRLINHINHEKEAAGAIGDENLCAPAVFKLVYITV